MELINKLKVGVIGCGGIAFQKHLPSLFVLKDTVSLVAFCDIEVEKAKQAADKFGNAEAKVYEKYRELLLDPTIDVVHVCTPNNSHAEITIAALEAGKHVMCEKPMAINAEEARKMLDAAKRTGKKLTIGYQNRFRKDSLILKEACENGDLGEVYLAKAHALRRRGVPTWGVFTDKEKQGGGPLIDIGTHSLDLALWMMKNYEPELVVGSTFHKLKDKHEGNIFGKWDADHFNVEDSAFGFVKMKNGATIILEAAWALNIQHAREAQVTLCGTEAGAELLGKNKLSINTSQYGQLTETNISADGEIAYFGRKELTAGELEAENWIRAILEDKEPIVKPKEAYVVTQILEAIYQSAETGRAIHFNEDGEIVR